MAMYYELGLIVTIAVCGWTAFDAVVSSSWRGRVFSLAALSVAAGLWASGELLLGHAAGPPERVFALRVLFIGACALGFCWFWVSVEAARPAWWRRAPWLLVLAALPAACFYATLYAQQPGWLIELDSATCGRRGPLFGLYLAYSWGLVAVGFYYFARAATRLRKASPQRMLALIAGTLLPLGGNVLYVALGADILPLDPTPVLIGIGGFLIRVAIFDSGLTPSLPVGHRDVIEQLEVGILVADLDDRVVDSNRVARDLLSAEEPRGLRLAELLGAAQREPVRTLEIRSFPLRSSFAIVGCGAVVTDRTEAHRAERRLQLAARLEAVGTLTAGIAHEVNNPLAYIRANLTQLEKVAWYFAEERLQPHLSRDGRELAKEGVELVAETVDGVDRIARLVERLRSFAREEPGSHVPLEVDLADVVERAVPMARVGLPTDAIVVRALPTPPVLGNQGDFVQILLNMLVNALQAANRDGPIEIELAPQEDGAVLRVLDRGPGIPSDAMPHIFDPFFTTKPVGSGSGLGLSLSYDLARQHGGRLEAANRPGGGAVFTLWLPGAGMGIPSEA